MVYNSIVCVCVFKKGVTFLYPVLKHVCVFYQAVVDAVLAISKPNEPIDLYMVEIMEMKHKTESDTQ